MFSLFPEFCAVVYLVPYDTYGADSSQGFLALGFRRLGFRGFKHQGFDFSVRGKV